MNATSDSYTRVSATLLVVILGLLLVLMQPAAAMESDHYAIPWNVWGSGGGPATSAAFSPNATIGQPAIGFSSSAAYELCSGFWCDAGHRLYLPLMLRNAP